MIRRRPPQVARALRSEENTRASRDAHRSRWAQGGALKARSVAVDSSTGLGGHDATAAPSPGGQDPVVAQEMKPGRGDQSRQLLQ